MTNNPADWTDAEIARWMAERDGGLSPRPYADSLDAAVAWLGRRGLEWCRTFDVDEGMYAMEALNSIIWRACYESPTCPTARALCNAGCAAEMARDASNG